MTILLMSSINNSQWEYISTKTHRQTQSHTLSKNHITERNRQIQIENYNHTHPTMNTQINTETQSLKHNKTISRL